MNPKNKEIIAGIIFFLIWIFGMIIWGNYKNIRADVSREYDTANRSFGHPLYLDN